MSQAVPRASNCSLISHIDCPGGGQVWVEGTTLFVGHMRQPSGTSIYDVEDPKKRSTGTYITLLAQAILLLGAGVGALLAWL